MSGHQEQIRRWSRQLVLPEVGRAGQQAWLASRVRVTGDGAGAWAASTWLAGAGVQTGHGADADRTLELVGADGLAGALRGVGEAGALLMELLPGGTEHHFELPCIPPFEVRGDPRVAVVGAGGLGCPAAIGLGLAGVRRLRLIDDDVVDISNLPRQVLHGLDDLGRPKVESAAEALRARFDGMEVEAIRTRLVPGNAEALLGDVDLVIEGSDNFPTKFRVNAAAAVLGVPAVIAGVLRLDGQALAVDPAGDGACYRCLFPEAPSPGAVPTCSSAGILGPVAGVLGLWQATLGLGTLAARRSGEASPAGHFWTFSARTGGWMSFIAQRQDDCPACGAEPDDPSLRGAAEGDGPMCAG
jgi:molybdopterin/thiamine biosynthesis adenylyltransferase